MKTGDLVILKSGGIPMTVLYVVPGGPNLLNPQLEGVDMANVIWMDSSNTMHREHLPVLALVLKEDSP